MFQASLQLYRNAYGGLSRPIWWLSFIIFINRSGTMVIPFLTVYLSEQKGYSDAKAGTVMAAFGLGSILGSYIGGRLTDRFGYLYVQVFSLFLSGLLFIVLGYMDSYAEIMSCIFILSTMGEAFRPANSAAIAAYSDDSNRTRSFSLNRLAVNLGFGIGPAAGGLLAEKSYNLLFWADGLTCMLASLLLLLIFSPRKTARKEKTTEVEVPKGESAWKDKIYLWSLLFLFLVGLCFFQLFTIIPLYYKNELGFSKSTTGWIMAMNGLIIAAFEMILVYKLDRKRSIFYYTTAGAFLIGISFLLLDITSIFPMVITSMIVITVGEMLLFPFLNNFWVLRSNLRNRGQYAAAYTMAFSAAIVLAPTLATQISTRAGYEVLWAVNFFLCTFAALGYSLLKKYVPNE